jgi:alpha-L-fucosidase 2
LDGTFGVTAAITEMLLQSHDGFIKLLPALPDDWSAGAFKGACARGAFELDYAWQNKQIKQLKIKSKAGGICRLEALPNVKVIQNGKTVAFQKLPNGIIEFKTVNGEVYVVE